MNENPVEPELKQLVQGTLPQMDTALRRDLWPQMQARLSEGKPGVAPIRLKWWEWALAAGDLGAAFYAPDAIPALLYHL